MTVSTLALPSVLEWRADTLHDDLVVRSNPQHIDDVRAAIETAVEHWHDVFGYLANLENEETWDNIRSHALTLFGEDE